MGDDWAYRTAGELVAAQRAGEVSAAELTEHAIARIGRYDGELNAICVPDFDRARAAARAADEARAAGDDRPLLGVPITVKESYNVAGLPTTWGSPAFKDFIPAEDALGVARVKAAGAVVLGKTNVPLMLGDLQSYNDVYGTTSNPWDRTRTPGGSSGGSAAALAAGFGPLSLGSDIGGSLRVPAHFCGVYAHKPTFGLLPARGHTPPPAPPSPEGRDLSVIGPMARTVSDLELLFDVLAEPDPLTLGRAYRLDLSPARHDTLAGFRVLVLEDHPLLPSSSDVRAAIGRVAGALADAGARVEQHSPLLPDQAENAGLYFRMLMATLAAGFPDAAYDGFREAAAGLDAGDTSLGAEVTRGAVLSHRDWYAAHSRRERQRQAWREFFTEFDIVLCPISPTPAFPHDHAEPQLSRLLDIDGTAHPYGTQLVWPGLATLPGLPATAIPAGRTGSGLPVGVQLVGPMFEDRTPLRLAGLLEAELGGFAAPPLG